MSSGTSAHKAERESMAQHPVTQLPAAQEVQHPVTQNQEVQHPVAQNHEIQHPMAQYPVAKNPQNKEPEGESSEDESSDEEFLESEDQHLVAGSSEVEAPPSINGFATKPPLYPLSQRGARSRGRARTKRRAQDCPKQQAINEALKTKTDADKVVARKMKNYWDKHSAEFPEEMKDSFISAFQKIRKTTSNAKSPSNHMIWKNTLSSCKEDLDWAKWIVLRAVYYDPITNSKEPEEQLFRANFMKNEVSKRIQQRYPGVNIFTAKVPNNLSAPRPSTWPVIGDTDGFQAVKEETPSRPRSRSVTVAPLGGIALSGKSSAGVKRKLNNSNAFEPATPAKVPRFTSRLQDAEEEIEEDEYLEKYNRHRSLQQRKPESFEPRPGGHQMSVVTQGTGNKFEPPIQTLEEKTQRHPAAVKDVRMVETATGYIIEPPIQTLEEKAQHHPAAVKGLRVAKTATGNEFEPPMPTLAEEYQNHPAAVENRLVARTTEQVKDELGFATKDDLLLYICQQMGDNMVIPQNMDVLEYLGGVADGDIHEPSNEPTFEATIQYFVANWVRSITDAVKKQLLGSESRRTVHYWAMVAKALEDTSCSLMAKLSHALKDIEKMMETFKPEELAQKMDKKLIYEAVVSSFNSNDELPLEVRNIIAKWFDAYMDQKYKPLIESWIQEAVAKNPVISVDEAHRTLRVSEQLKEDHGKWVDERIQQSMPKYLGDAGHLSDKEVNRVAQQMETRAQNNIYGHIVKVLSDYPDIKAGLQRVSEQAISEAIANARINGQLELSENEAIGSSHLLPVAERVQILEQEIRSLKETGTTQTHLGSLGFNAQRLHDIEMELKASRQMYQGIDTYHRQEMTRRSRLKREVTRGFYCALVVLGITIGATLAAKNDK